jgi:hypothetical protein
LLGTEKHEEDQCDSKELNTSLHFRRLQDLPDQHVPLDNLPDAARVLAAIDDARVDGIRSVDAK